MLVSNNHLPFFVEEDVIANIIFIDSKNAFIRPPNARDPKSDAYKNYVPAYNCSLVSNDQTSEVDPPPLCPGGLHLWNAKLGPFRCSVQLPQYASTPQPDP